MTLGEGGEAAAQPPRKRSDLGARVVVAIPGAVLALAFVYLGGVAWAALIAVMACAGTSELYRMLPDWRPVPLVGFAVALGMCAAARYGSAAEVIGVAMAGIPLVFLALLARGQTAGATLSIASTLFGIFWVGLALSHAVLLRQLPHGAALVLDVMLGTFLADTFAYLGGRLVGRHPLAPSVSPKKTIEGLSIGAVAAVAAVLVAELYQSSWLSRGDALILGVAIAILGPLGDLFESLVKRDAGTKDAGSLFGAHGGALDRLDAVMFTVVAAYYIAIHIPGR